MKQMDIRKEVQKYIEYLNTIRNQNKTAEVNEELGEVIKSLRAILEKTEFAHY